MRVSARAMNMTVGEFFLGRHAHFGNGAGEQQRHAGEWMIAIDHHLVGFDLGDGEQHLVLVVFGGAFELHSDFDLLGKQVARLDVDQGGIIFAEGLAGFQFDLERSADVLAMQRFLDARENAVVAAMDIDERFVSGIDARFNSFAV